VGDVIQVPGFLFTGRSDASNSHHLWGFCRQSHYPRCRSEQLFADMFRVPFCLFRAKSDAAPTDTHFL